MDISKKIFIPGQFSSVISLHVCVSEGVDPSAVQSSPPFSGVGLLHERSLDCEPSPHVAEHADHSAQSPQPPLT